MIQARNVAQIGVEGVVLSESERCFHLAVLAPGTKDMKDTSDSSAAAPLPTPVPRVLTVPKPHTVFVFQWADRLITIYGNHFIQRSADRSAKKYVFS